MKKKLLWTTLFFYFFGSISLQIILDLIIADNESVFYLFGQLVMYFILIIPLIIINKNDLLKIKKILVKRDLLTGFVVWLVGTTLLIGTNYLINYVILPDSSLTTNEILIRQMIDKSLILAFILIVILMPFLEEMVFRYGFKEIKNKFLYLVIPASLFAFLHIVADFDEKIMLIHFFPYFFLGLTFGLVYQKTNNIFITIIIHSFHNLLCLILYLL